MRTCTFSNHVHCLCRNNHRFLTFMRNRFRNSRLCTTGFLDTFNCHKNVSGGSRLAPYLQSAKMCVCLKEICVLYISHTSALCEATQSFVACRSIPPTPMQLRHASHGQPSIDFDDPLKMYRAQRKSLGPVFSSAVSNNSSAQVRHKRNYDDRHVAHVEVS